MYKRQDSKQVNKNLKLKKVNKYLVEKENSLIEHLGTKVNIKKTKSTKAINIHFTDDDDLDRIIDIIKDGN